MVTVVFNPGDTSASKYSALSQYDYGQVLRIQGLNLPAAVEIDFALQPNGGTSIPRIGITKDGVTDVVIPDSMLENNDSTNGYSIYAFVFLTDATSGQTEYRITLGVTARPKPEVPGGGDNPDIFHEAVQAVREAAEQAAESEKQAEGWAHGREDLPERAEDNARYYAGQAQEDSRKTAEDRKEVERLVESVSGIDEQVAKVEELSKNAQGAATRAETSAEQGEIHKQAAENASTAAQTAAGKTAEDRAAVQKTKEAVAELNTQVQETKDSVDKTAQEFTLAAQRALADVNNAGQTQTDRVQTAGETAVRDIQTAQRTATGAVETAKTEAVKTVQTEGATQTGKVTAEGEKQVQAVQAAAQEIIADREQIQTNKTDIADLRQSKAGAVVETAKGSVIQIADSAEAFMEGLKIFGKSEQVTTTGAQLFDTTVLPDTITENGITITNDNGVIRASGTFTDCEANLQPVKRSNIKAGTYVIGGGLPYFYPIIEHNGKYIIGNTTRTFKVETDSSIAIYVRVSGDISKTPIIKPMLNAGETALPWEPYTGGKPSPSPDYPQEIKSILGEGNPEIKFIGKNILLAEANKFVTTGWAGRLEKIENGVRLVANSGWLTATTAINNIEGKTITLTLTYKQVANQTTSENSKNAFAVFTSDKANGFRKIVWHTDAPNTTETSISVTFIAQKYIGFYLSLSAEGNYLIRTIDVTNIQIEYGDTATEFEPYKEQIITFPLQNGLPGIPVTSGGNYTDAEGQQWVCDEIDLERGKYVQRIKTINAKNIVWVRDPAEGKARYTSIQQDIKKNGGLMSNRFTRGRFSEAPGLCSNEENKKLRCCFDSTFDTLDKVTQFFSENETIFMYEITEPIETDLTPEEIAAYKALHTYAGTTVVTNDSGAYMELSYVADTELYIDKKLKELVTANIQKTANLLSLMPLSTQAAMIENDTNNILDNMEAEK